ncbi:hypothetical protein [Nonomuraea dietziae]|uniref:hypothetical protein n=1 Tax=Nonomuraea dietziae TaxID=65515 RepID=UPI0031CFDE29
MSEPMRTSTRDLDDLRERLSAWLGRRVSRVTRPSANGMSSETLFFTVDGTRVRGAPGAHRGGRADLPPATTWACSSR